MKHFALGCYDLPNSSFFKVYFEASLYDLC